MLKENNWEVLSAPANVAREYDGGDFWELYGTLNGARLTAMKSFKDGPHAVLLAATIPVDAMRVRLGRVLARHWDEGPATRNDCRRARTLRSRAPGTRAARSWRSKNALPTPVSTS